jgi:phosphoribosylaminoimidazole carboxylase PurE protein
MGVPEQSPLVGIIMGSDSDLGVMQHVGRALNVMGLEQGVDYEERVVSAHRTPAAMVEYAQAAEERGLRVIVAGAGGSAHLQGMTASETILPVLGVAITSNPDVMNRALGSCIGMPEGKPLATFQDKAGAFNAGLFAVRLLIQTGVRPGLRRAYLDYDKGLEDEVRIKDVNLHGLGAKDYLERKRREAEAAERQM